MAAVVFLAHSRRALLVRGVVIWLAMRVHHALKDIIGRISQNMEERCSTDK